MESGEKRIACVVLLKTQSVDARSLEYAGLAGHAETAYGQRACVKQIRFGYSRTKRSRVDTLDCDEKSNWSLCLTL